MENYLIFLIMQNYIKDKESVSCFLFKQYMQHYYNNFDSINKDREL